MGWWIFELLSRAKLKAARGGCHARRYLGTGVFLKEHLQVRRVRAMADVCVCVCLHVFVCLLSSYVVRVAPNRIVHAESFLHCAMRFLCICMYIYVHAHVHIFIEREGGTFPQRKFTI